MIKWLKAFFVLGLAAILLSSLVSCGGGSVCSAKPEDALRGAFKALEAKDSEKLVNYYVEEVRPQIASMMGFAFSLVDNYKISNLEISVESQTADEATIKVEYDRKIEAGGSKTEEHVKETYELAKRANCWQLLGDATESETEDLGPSPTPKPTPAPVPEDTVNLYLTYLEALDANGVSKCFISSLSNQIRQDVEKFRSQVTRARIYNKEITVVSQTSNKATIEANYIMEITAFGQTQGAPIKETIQLDKVGDEWLISNRVGPGGW
jgi:hypothetical protein